MSLVVTSGKQGTRTRISAPFTEGCDSSASCAPGRFGQEAEGCDATPEGLTILGQRACPSPSYLSHMPQPVKGAERHQDQAAPPVPLSKHTWYSLSPCSPLQSLWRRDLCLLTLPTLGCSLGDFTSLVAKSLAAGLPSLVCVPRKDHLNLPVHQAGNSRRKRHYTSLTVWLLVCLITCHSPCSTVKTRKQAECSK